MAEQKLTMSIWFQEDNGDIEKVVDYYQAIFKEHWKSGPVIPLGITPSGKASMCQVNVMGKDCSLLCTSEQHHELNDAVSLVIHCANQEEIDRYWNYFTQEGKEAPCGWCQDRYGLRWQIIPADLGKLLQRENGYQIMMGQKKIIIDQY
jgi:predicted 3-demethylubiquinone-9 3-methyltransferase (glyoxalase superfamily)